MDSSLRASVFGYVVSGILVSMSGVGAQGIFCRRHRRIETIKWSLLTGIFGWWSLGGIIATPIVLVRNIRGGAQNKAINAKLLSASAEILAERGDSVEATHALETASAMVDTPELAARLAEIRGY